MKWRKLGRILEPRPALPWMRTHVMVPIADHLEGDIFRIYFSGRDDLNRSCIGYALLDIGRVSVLEIAEEPVLTPGELGCFDDNGVTPSWIVNDGTGRKLLYYIGWRPRSTTRMSVIAGLALSDDGGKRFMRASRAPILRLTNAEPFSILTAPCVMMDAGRWRMWYVSGTGWVHQDLPRYNIKYAESADGVHWEQTGRVCIDSSTQDETSLARPCVIRDAGGYRMWYSTKKGGKGYRIGYAESMDGLSWNRMDHRAAIDVSESGWDSEMIEYPFVFGHEGRRFMLYNGNDYGRNGAGLAVCEEP